nr:MAG TPA: hypothetical protein [Caudoviricetes sp.]
MRFSVLYDRINPVHISFISPTIKLVVKKPCGAFFIFVYIIPYMRYNKYGAKLNRLFIM